MKLLALDGNSIVNRAFYGIKVLTTKNGEFTNGIVGFLNILERYIAELKPHLIAISAMLKSVSVSNSTAYWIRRFCIY